MIKKIMLLVLAFLFIGSVSAIGIAGYGGGSGTFGDVCTVDADCEWVCGNATDTCSACKYLGVWSDIEHLTCVCTNLTDQYNNYVQTLRCGDYLGSFGYSCRYDHQCFSENCVFSPGIYKPGLSNNGHCGYNSSSECVQDFDCLISEECEYGVCVSDSATICDSLDCNTVWTYCNGTACLPNPGRCNNNDDCLEFETCFDTHFCEYTGVRMNDSEWIFYSNGTSNHPCFNGVRDVEFGESGIDCGGGCGQCASGVGCYVNTDCASGYCNTLGVCAVPSCSDGAMNGNELGLDCGGYCPPCDKCSVDADCSANMYCELSSRRCVVKKPDYAFCSQNNECNSSNCGIATSAFSPVSPFPRCIPTAARDRNITDFFHYYDFNASFASHGFRLYYDLLGLNDYYGLNEPVVFDLSPLARDGVSLSSMVCDVLVYNGANEIVRNESVSYNSQKRKIEYVYIYNFSSLQNVNRQNGDCKIVTGKYAVCYTTAYENIIVRIACYDDGQDVVLDYEGFEITNEYVYVNYGDDEVISCLPEGSACSSNTLMCCGECVAGICKGDVLPPRREDLDSGNYDEICWERVFGCDRSKWLCAVQYYIPNKYVAFNFCVVELQVGVSGGAIGDIISLLKFWVPLIGLLVTVFCLYVLLKFVRGFL